jgi:hypothetical protein
MLDQTEVVDNVSDLSVTPSAFAEPDAAYEEWVTDCDRAHEAERELDDAMLAAAEADGVDAAGFADLTPERYAAIIAMMPDNTGWSPLVRHDAAAEQPYVGELRRGTPNGPDVVNVGRFYEAENALTAAVLFLINMKLVDLGHRRQIAYAARG